MLLEDRMTVYFFVFLCTFLFYCVLMFIKCTASHTTSFLLMLLGRFRSTVSTSMSSQLRNQSTHIEREWLSKLILGKPSSMTFATNLELNRMSLELVILAKIHVQFISNCLDKK